MPIDSRSRPDEELTTGPEHKKTFSFSFSFGRKPRPNDPDYERLVDAAIKDAESSGTTTDMRDVLNVEYSDGKLRVGDGTGEQRQPTAAERSPSPEALRDAEMWDRLEHIGTGAFADTARMHRALRTIVAVLGLSVPLTLLILGLVTGQSGNTIFFMTLFGLVIGAMFISTFPGRR